MHIIMEKTSGQSSRYENKKEQVGNVSVEMCGKAQFCIFAVVKLQINFNCRRKFM